MNFAVSGGATGLIEVFAIFGSAMIVFVIIASVIRQRALGTGSREPGDERTDNDDPI